MTPLQEAKIQTAGNLDQRGNKVIAVDHLNNWTRESQEVQYAQLMDAVKGDMERIIEDPSSLDEYRQEVQHGAYEEEMSEAMYQDFSTRWLPEHIEEVKYERLHSGDPKAEQTVTSLTQKDVERIGQLAHMDYVTSRDLLGPVIVGCTESIGKMQEQGALPGRLQGFMRDFYPFYVAGKDLQVPIEPLWLRRALHGIKDSFDSKDTAELDEAHIGKLIKLYEKGGLLTQDVTLLDTGMYGSITYEILVMRESLNRLAIEGKMEEIIAKPAHQREAYFYNSLPPHLIEALSTTYSENEMTSATRFAMLRQLLTQRSDILEQLNPNGMKTAMLNLSSRHDNDPRFQGSDAIRGWLETVGEDVLPPALGSVIICDTFEESVLASKFWKGPTKLDDNGNPVLYKNGLESEMRARASRKGVQHAVMLHQENQRQGQTHDVRNTLSHMMDLHGRSSKDGKYRGIIGPTPPWQHGKFMVEYMYPMVAQDSTTLQTIPREAVLNSL